MRSHVAVCTSFLVGSYWKRPQSWTNARILDGQCGVDAGSRVGVCHVGPSSVALPIKKC